MVHLTDLPHQCKRRFEKATGLEFDIDYSGGDTIFEAYTTRGTKFVIIYDAQDREWRIIKYTKAGVKDSTRFNTLDDIFDFWLRYAKFAGDVPTTNQFKEFKPTEQEMFSDK